VGFDSKRQMFSSIKEFVILNHFDVNCWFVVLRLMPPPF